MSKKESLSTENLQALESQVERFNNGQINHTFSPSIQVNPTITVTTETPVNIKNEQPKDASRNSRGGFNSIKRIVVAVVIGLTISVVGFYLKKSLSKGDPSQEELHQPTLNANSHQ